MKNQEIINAFVSGEEMKTKNLFSEKDGERLILYSYGYHFPIAIRFKCGKLLINSNGYSKTTAKHKGDFSRAIGYNSFKELFASGKETLLDTKTLQRIMDDKNINSYSDFIALQL
jgi:hypothetical protein